MIDQFKLIYYYYYEFYYYCGCARVCAGMCVGGWVCTSVHWCVQVCVKVCGCLRVCAWDEFSEYLLENRVPTSADFNTYPIRILFSIYCTRSNPAFTFTFLFLLSTSSELGKMFGYSSHTHTEEGL